MPCTESGKRELKLVLISGHAAEKPELQFTSLAHLLDKEFLRHCFYSLNTQRRLQAGVEDQSKKIYQQMQRDDRLAQKDKKLQKKPKEWWDTLKAKLRGHFQYYGVSGNYRSINAYYKHTIRMLYKWLNRRSKKRSIAWENYKSGSVRGIEVLHVFDNKI